MVYDIYDDRYTLISSRLLLRH